MTPSPPAGWYPNPDGTSSQRWWDGSAWTQQTQAPGMSWGPPGAWGTPYAAQPGYGAPTPVAPPVGPGDAPYRPAQATGSKVGPSVGLSISILGVGVVMCIASLAIIGVHFADAIGQSDTFVTPGAARLHLSAGNLVVYQEVSSGFGTFSSPTLTPGEVSVVGPGGSSLPTSTTFVGTVTVNGVTYVAAVGFSVPSSGTYVVEVRGSAGRVAVGPSLGDLVRQVLGWIIAALAGLLTGIAGIVLLIVGVVRRKRARRAAWSGYPW